MELSQAEIMQKPKMQELSSLFMTHRLSVMQALVKFHEYISYSLGVMARTQLTIFFFFFFFLIWVLRPFQEYFTYIERIVHRRWAKTGEPGEKTPDYP